MHGCARAFEQSLSLYFWVLRFGHSHSMTQSSPGGLFIKINVGVCTSATGQRPDSAMETKSFHSYRLVHMTVTNICWAPSLKGNRVVSRIFELPCDVCLTSTKKEAFRNSSLLFSPSAFSVPTWNRRAKAELFCRLTSPLYSHRLAAYALNTTLFLFWALPVFKSTVITLLTFTVWQQWFIEKTRLYNPYSMPWENGEFLFLAWWSCVSDQNMHSLWHLLRMQSIKMYLYSYYIHFSTMCI